MEHILISEQWIDRPREVVFPFFSKAENLTRITPPELTFRILTPTPVEMREGALIDYRLGLGPIRFLWKTEITRWDPPHAFVDEQLKGPYKQWIHLHEFEDHGDRSLIRDQVRYRLPLEPLGDLGYPLIRHQLGRIFSYRRDIIADVFSTSDTNTSAA